MRDAHSPLSRYSVIVLILAFCCSAALKIGNLYAGGPYVTIDDGTAFEGGFLVWLGQAPPQRMFFESWIIGSVCLLTYMAKTFFVDGETLRLGVNFIADAFKDFYAAPDVYVHVYRSFALMLDLITAVFVYILARQVLRNKWNGLAAAIVCVMYLFSYNTLWCNLVARPDSLTALFAVIGMVFYIRSGFGNTNNYFYLSAIALGVATGLKLHAAFFVIFILFDLIRIHGIAAGTKKALPFIIISVFFFGFSAGSPFFDPLRYIKLRLLNYRDDISPWIQWGEQFVQILKGSGWMCIPFLLGAAFYLRKKTVRQKEPIVTSIMFQAIFWLLLFASIRQLRAYWMLPVLPLFYIGAVYGLTGLNSKKIAGGSVCLVLGVMLFQTALEFKAFAATDFNQLRMWVKTHIKHEEPFYILGYNALTLPRNTACIKKLRDGYRRNFEKHIDEGKTYTERHIKNWEEESRLMLYDMLGFQFDKGFTFYSYYSQPLDAFEPLIQRDNMRYVLLQEHFLLGNNPEWKDFLDSHCVLVAETIGPGGGGKGLRYLIYKRK